MKQPKDNYAWLGHSNHPAQFRLRQTPLFSPLTSLRVRLMFFVLLAVLPILGIMLYAAFESRQQQAAKVEEDVQTLTQLAVDNHEKLIEGTRQLLISLAESSEIQNGDGAACSQKLKSLLEQSQGYATFAVANLDGTIFCSAIPLNRRVNVANQTWFQQAIDTRDFVIDTYRIEPISGKANLPLSYPVLNAAEQVQGVIVTGLDLTALNRSMAKTSLPDMAALIVIDRNGTILARYPNSDEWTGRTILSAPLIEAILTRGRGVVEVPDVDNITRLYAFSPLRHNGEREIYLGVGVPRQVAFAQLNRLWARNLAGLGLIGLLAMGVAWWGSDILVLRPINALIRAAQELRHNLSTRTGLAYSSGELGQLARTFDEMATIMEQRVVARTAELRAANSKLAREMAEHRQTQAELVEMQRRLMESIEAERLHLAQDLHDGPIQDLYSISYSLNGLQEIISDEADQTQLATVKKTLGQVIHSLRATSGELRPPTLAPFGLEKAIRSHVESFQEIHPEIEMRLDLMPDGQILSERVRLALFRICQEALNNIGRHAQAQRVIITLKINEKTVGLDIEDDGCGFNVPRRWIGLARQGHLGLVGMSERAEALGGKLEIDSVSGAGTVVSVRLPRNTGDVHGGQASAMNSQTDYMKQRNEVER
jgi:signal transduction histidine kinase